MFKVVSDGMKLINVGTDAVTADVVRNRGKYDIVLTMLDKKAVFKTFSSKDEAISGMHELRYTLNVMLEIMPSEDK